VAAGVAVQGVLGNQTCWLGFGSCDLERIGDTVVVLLPVALNEMVEMRRVME
jgi:hypothetical protein